MGAALLAVGRLRAVRIRSVPQGWAALLCALTAVSVLSAAAQWLTLSYTASGCVFPSYFPKCIKVLFK